MAQKLERLTERHMKLLEARMQGQTFKTIGNTFNLTAAGVRVQVNYATCKIRQKGAHAFPEGYIGAYPEAHYIAYAQYQLPHEVQEHEYTIAITKQQVGYVKIRATNAKDALYWAKEQYPNSSFALPEMEDCKQLRYSVVETKPILNEE